jgi:amidase
MSKPREIVTRRAFLEASALGAVAATLRPAAAQPPAAPARSLAPAAPAQAGQFELAEKTVAELQAGMRSGQYTARSLAERYLRRIAEVDASGPTLRAVIETNPDALGLADQLDQERKTKGARGPLHGIPVLIKDNVATADKMQTTAGSLALVGSRPPRDAFIVERLRQAGAVILGKTNLSEWANFRSTHSSSGWSGRGGQCRNPYALDRNPCGSSSGTGAAIASSLAAVGVGTETDGSIVCPSSANSLVGIKPTLGLVSRSGIIPIAHSQDTAGPMCRTVTDAAILLGAMAGVDPRDGATAASSGKVEADYTKFLDANGLKGARIGVARAKFFGQSEKGDAVVEAAIAVLKQQGATIVDPADIPHTGEFDDTEFDVLLYEFKADLNAYLAGLGPSAPVHTLQEIIDFNERNKDREMPFFAQEIMLRAQEKGPLTEQKYLDALAKNHRLSRVEGVDAVMEQHKLDAIVTTTGGPPWVIDLVDGDHFVGGSSTPAAVAGYASITVPAGYTHGLPVGMSFIGRAYSEPTLLKLAYAFEQASKARHAPTFAASVDK